MTTPAAAAARAASKAASRRGESGAHQAAAGPSAVPEPTSSTDRDPEEPMNVDAIKQILDLNAKGRTGISDAERVSIGKQIFQINIDNVMNICLVSQVFGAKFFNCDTARLATVNRIFAECMKIDAFDRAQPLKQPGAPSQPPSH